MSVKSAAVTIAVVWLVSFGYLVLVAIGPELGGAIHVGSTAKVGATAASNWPLHAAARLKADPKPILALCGAAVSTVFTVWFFVWAKRKQLAAASTAESRAVSYLVTMPRDEAVAIPQMREFWLWVRRGASAGWWQRVTGTAPYIAWCDLATTGTHYQSASYVRVVGDERVQQAVRHALEALHAEATPLPYPQVTIGTKSYHLHLYLARSSEHPIRTDFDVETEVRAVLAKYLRSDANISRVEVAYRLRPAGAGWAGAAKRRAARLREHQSIGEWRGEQEQRGMAMRTKVPHGTAGDWRAKLDSDAYGWDADITITATGADNAARELIQTIAQNYFGLFTATNRFVAGPLLPGPAPLGYPVRFSDRTILSPAECAALCHLPCAADVPGLAASPARIVEAAKALWVGELPTKAGKPYFLPTSLARLAAVEAVKRPSVFGYQRGNLIGISRVERFKAAMFVGPPGVGKSVALANLALGDCASGDGAAVFEPHGDLCRHILSRLAPADWGRVIYFDPQELFERGRAATINVMEGGADPLGRPALQAMIMEVFRSIAGTNWAAANRMQSLLESAIACVLETVAEPTMKDLFRFITNTGFRKYLEAKATNPIIRQYWAEYFDKVDYREQQNMIGPLVTRITKTLLNPYAANIVSGKHSTIDMRDVLENGKILLVNLPGAGQSSGDPTMALIGMLLIVRLRIEAAKRIRIHEDLRRPFYLTIDEAHLMVSRDIEDMIAQFRKLRVALTLAFQSLGQIDKQMLQVLLATIANRVIFRGEGVDTETLAEELLGGEVRPQDVASLANFTAYVRLMEQGTPQRVCTLNTLPLAEPPQYQHPTADLRLAWQEAAQKFPASGEVARLVGLISRSLSFSEQAFYQPTNTNVRTKADAAQQQAIAELVRANDEVFKEVGEVQIAREGYVASWLLAHPGAYRSQSELIKRVSMLRYSRPAVLIVAETGRDDLRVAATSKRRGEGQVTTPASSGGSQPAANPNLAATEAASNNAPAPASRPLLPDYGAGVAVNVATVHPAPVANTSPTSAGDARTGAAAISSGTAAVTTVTTPPATPPTPASTSPTTSSRSSTNPAKTVRPRRAVGWGDASGSTQE